MTADTMLLESLPRVHAVLGAHAPTAQAFSLPNGLTGYAIAAPGTVLSPATQDAIFAALVPVTTASFAADMTPYWASRRAGGYFGRLAEFVLIADGEDRMVGWTGHSVLDRGAFANVYVDSTGMVPVGQSRGVMRQVFRLRLLESAFRRYAGREHVYVSARTESPIVYKLMRPLVPAGAFYPDPGAPTPDDVFACCRDLAEWLGQSAILEPGSLVLRGAYASLDALYGELPSTGDPTLDVLFRERLGPLDAYLVIGRVDTSPSPERG